MPIRLEVTSCCGLRIIKGMKSANPKQSMIEVCARMYNGGRDCAFVMFSDESKNGKAGNNFKKFISVNKLGTVKESIKNGTKVWFWQVSNSRAIKWFNNNRITIHDYR